MKEIRKMEANAQIEINNSQNDAVYCVAGAVLIFIGWFVAHGLVCGLAAIALGVYAWRKGSKGAGQAIISMGIMLAVKTIVFILVALFIEEIYSRLLPFLK
jgi:hypothetical protein